MAESAVRRTSVAGSVQRGTMSATQWPSSAKDSLSKTGSSGSRLYATNLVSSAWNAFTERSRRSGEFAATNFSMSRKSASRVSSVGSMNSTAARSDDALATAASMCSSSSGLRGVRSKATGSTAESISVESSREIGGSRRTSVSHAARAILRTLAVVSRTTNEIICRRSSSRCLKRNSSSSSLSGWRALPMRSVARTSASWTAGRAAETYCGRRWLTMCTSTRDWMRVLSA
eukprot:Amastigsp_a515780_3.p4 type:complete len:231 gc:universal Amastigsp_a515780_3:1830-1138(-)